MKLRFVTSIMFMIMSRLAALEDPRSLRNLVLDIIEAEKKPYAIVILGYNKNDSANIMKLIYSAGYTGAVINNPPVLHGYPLLDNVIFAINLSSAKAHIFLKRAEEQHLFSAPYRWIMVYENISTNVAIQNYLSGFNIPIKSGVVLIGIDSSAEEILAHKIYRITPQSDFVLEVLGSWSFVNVKFTKILRYTIGENRSNLNGTILKTVLFIMHNSTRHHLMDRRDKHKDVHAKVDYAILKLLMECMNATITFEIADMSPNLRKDKQLLQYSFQKQSDIIGYGVVPHEELLDEVDLIGPMGRSRSMLMFLQPQLSNLKNIYTLQFQPRVWYLLGLSLFTVWILGISVAKWEMKNLWKNEEDPTALQKISSIDVFFDIFCKICKQKSLDIYRSVTGNLLAAVFMFYILILTTSYSANIVSLLNSSPRQITTFEDLVNAPFNIYMDKSGYDLYMLQNHSDPVRQEVFWKKIVHKTIESAEEGVRKIKSEGIGFLGNMDESSDCIETEFSEKEKCQLDYINMLSVYQAWLVLPKNSTLSEVLKMKMRKLAESGLKKREYKLMFSRKPECQKGKTFINVTWKDCSFLHLVLLLGIALSILILMLEVAHCIPN